MGMGDRLRRVASAFTYPLAPDDFLGLVNPLASSKQLRALVESVTPESENAVTVRFKPGRGWDTHRAGQYVRIGVEIDGRRHWRSYSLTSPQEGAPTITVSRVGLVSGWIIDHAAPGDVWYLDLPQGDFVLPDHPRPLLMVTAGSGLTPVMSMLRTLVRRREDANVVLLHSARTRALSLFTDELSDLSAAHPGLRVLLRWTSEQGRLDLSDSRMLDHLVPDWRERAAYVCGPADLLTAAHELWQQHPECTLSIEQFTPPRFTDDSAEGGRVAFTIADREVEVDGSTPLLLAGEQAGVLMRSGCRMGICRSCLVPLVAGRVRDLTTGAVGGVEGELIRTCVSAPAGDVRIEC